MCLNEAKMGQVTIYLDDETEKQARNAAQAKGVSLSRWVAEKVQHGARVAWPPTVRELAGKWADVPSADDIRKGAGTDIVRGKL
jgi:hypothetical protein